jgi:excisionase family DNA binding protein
MNNPVYLRPREVAERLGVDIDVVLHWLHTGELVGFNVAQVAGRRPRWRIAEEELQRFLQRRSMAPVPSQQRQKRQSPQPAPIIFYRHGRRVAQPKRGAT